MTEEEVRARFRSHFDEYLATTDAAAARLRAGVRGAAALALAQGASEADLDAAFLAEMHRSNVVLDALCERQTATTN